MDHVRAIRDALAPHDSPERLERADVEVIIGHGRFVGPGRIAVGEHELRCRTAVIATGSRARSCRPGRAGSCSRIGAKHSRDRASEDLLFTGGEPPRSSLVRPPMRGREGVPSLRCGGAGVLLAPESVTPALAGPLPCRPRVSGLPTDHARDACQTESGALETQRASASHQEHQSRSPAVAFCADACNRACRG
jgi:hypothetical protein